MAKILITFITIFLILGILSCEAPMGFMGDSMPNDEIIVKSIEDGAFLTKGDEIPLALEYDVDEVVLEKLTIELFSSDGKLIASQELGYIDLQQEQLPAIDFPDIDPGLYTIEYTGFDEEGEKKLSREIDFFYADGIYSVKNITSYPPVITPGTEALLAAQLQFPSETDPYVRWSMGDEVLSEGQFSDHYDKLQWNAPRSEGVYSIKVELFPLAPPSGMYDFTSSAYMEAEFFVTSRREAAGDGFYPDEHYYSVFHFQGNWQDYGKRTDLGIVEPIGSPVVDVRGNLFGYYLDGSSGFNVDQMLLPLTNKNLAPFTVKAKLYLDERPENASFFSTESADGKFSFALSTNKEGILESEIRFGNTAAARSSSSLVLDPNSAYTIALSVVPGANAITFQWFINGKAVRQEEKVFSAGQIEQKGSASLGGPRGFRGVIDEFGIFYKDRKNRAAIDPDIYYRKMSEQYGTDLMYAEGFDGLYFPDSLEKNNLLSVENGYLVIKPDGELQIPQISVSHERVTAEIEVSSLLKSSDQELTINSLDGSFDPLSVGFNGVVTLNDGSSRNFTYSEGIISTEIIHEEGKITITVNGQEVYSMESGNDFVPLQLVVANGKSNETLKIERILIFSESLRLVKRESSSSDEGEKSEAGEELEEYSNA